MSPRVRAAAVLLCVVGAVLAPTLSAGAAERANVTIRGTDVSDFPVVRLTVSTSSTAELDRADVSVVENGVPVEVESVKPLDALGRPVAAVLAIDVSNSMKGVPLDTAVAAAKTFLQAVPPSLRVGVLTFAEQPAVLTSVSLNRAAATDVIDSIGVTTSQGTALYDAVIAAAGMFDPEGAAQHNVVLVTDGQNTTGTGDLAAAKAAAVDAGVNVYTIGLAGATTDAATLKSIAATTGGSYSAISPSELTSVYSGIADELVHQYDIAYRSKAPYGAAVEIGVELPAGDATAGFFAPGLGSVEGEAAGRPATDPGPLGGSFSMALIAALTFLASFGAIAVVSDARDRRRREAQLRSRTQGSMGPAWEMPKAMIASNQSLVPKQIAEFAERGVGARRRRLLSGRLRQAAWSLGVGEFLAIVVAAMVVCGAGGAIVFKPVIGVAAAAVAAVVPFVILSSAAAKRLGRIQAQLADTLMVIASAMRAGHSFLQALDNAAKEIDEPAASEFSQVLAEVRLGRDIDDALDALVDRVGSTDLEWAVTAIKIQRQVGGNLAEVLETVAKTIRERETLRRQVKVLSAEGRYSMVVLFCLPVGIAMYLMLVNPDYLRILVNTRPGIIILSGSVVLMVIGFFWMKRIVRLDV